VASKISFWTISMRASIIISANMSLILTSSLSMEEC
jgi:hypothetical protein